MYVTIAMLIYSIFLGMTAIAIIIGLRNSFMEYLTDGDVNDSIVDLYKKDFCKVIFFVSKPNTDLRYPLAEIYGNIVYTWVFIGAFVALLWPLVIVSLFGYGILYFTRGIFRIKKKIDKLSSNEQDK